MKVVCYALFLVFFSCAFLFCFEDGTYEGMSVSSTGPMKVGVTVVDGKISDVRILSHSANERSKALRIIPERIKAKGHYEGIKTVQGESILSKAVIFAVKAAFLKAQKSDRKTDSGNIQKTELLAPPEKGDKSLIECLWNRQTRRKFKSKKLSLKLLSELLWAARGVNRLEEKKLVVPSAYNWQQIDVYVALEKGLYFYNSYQHQLELVLKEDLRNYSGAQWFKKLVPAALIYVVDYDRMTGGGSMEQKLFYAATDTGFISQNVYLYCASKNLATVVLGGKKNQLEKKMKLGEWEKVVLTQVVGYPVED